MCSSCRAPLADGTIHCPRCGPGSLALLGAEHAPLAGAAPEAGRETALARALGHQYRVVRLLGRGGFAEVYEVRDEDLQRRLAVKVLRADLPWSPGTLARFKQEARAIARLSHPNTLAIHFVGEAEGLVCYAMPFCEGRTLTEVLRQDGPLSVGRALAIAEPIFETLQHAHEHGLVHRDIKPDNILIEAGTERPLLLDFGIVKDVDGGSGHTQTGFIVGTPLYMSPEQALGRADVDARSDVYGMGVVLFQMVTGAPPFEGNDSREIVSRHLHEPVPVGILSRERVPPWLTEIIAGCLAKRPEERYQSARAALDALRIGRATAPFRGGRGGRPLGGDGPAASARAATQDETPTRPIRPARVAGGRRRALVALGLTAIAGGLWASARPRAALVVHNRLTEPIALTLDDRGFTVGAGDSLRLALRVGEPLEAHWAMVRPAAIDGGMRGAALEGSVEAEEPRGEVRHVVRAGGDGIPRFSPLIVNSTRRRLHAAVLSGRDSTDCGCSVAPGDSVRLGYYLLAPGSAVRVGDDGRATHRFAVILDAVDSTSGAVVIRVSDSALVRPAPRAAPSARPIQRGAARPPKERPAPVEPAPDPLKSFLPVR